MKEILESCPVVHRQVTWEIVGDAIFILQLDTGYACVLKQVARDIWKLIDGRRRVSEIAKELSRSYDTEKQMLAKDVAGFILSLQELQLIRLQKTPQKSSVRKTKSATDA